MMPGPGLRFTGPRGVMLVIASSIVVLALALVAPVDGQSSSSEHRFQLVHPVFSHVHQASVDHGHPDDADGEALVPPPVPSLTVSPLASFGTGPSVASVGLLLPASQAVLVGWLALAGAWRDRRLTDQASLAVPTGPPR